MPAAIRRIVGVIALTVALALPAAQSQREAEADLKALKDRIQRVQRQVQQDTVEKNQATRALRDAEKRVSSAQNELKKLRDERAERQAAQRALDAQRKERQADQQRSEAQLAAQLRAAYMLGRNEPLKLLLNQRDPGEASRNLAYYGYFGRQRAAEIHMIEANIAEIERLSAEIEEEEARLTRLEAEQKARVAELDSARADRGKVLASIQRQATNRTASLRNLQRERTQMEDLIKRLAKAAESVPYDPNAPFAKVRGALSWPVAGKIAVSFGQTPAGGIPANGIEVDASHGTEVRAVHEGRVLFADWRPGRGLVVIIDHGNDYWSLYGHNEQLFKSELQLVKAGDVIATAGDTGGRKRPGLYFEIRHKGKPVDPRPWFRSRTPPER